MQILVGIGVGDLTFGLTQAQAQAILGVADKSFETDGGCQRLQFYQAMLELSFEPDNDGLLGWIEIHNSEATLFGHKLVGTSREKVLEVITDRLGPPSECEDYDSFDTVFYEEKWLELQFEFGKLRNLNIGVLYGEDDQPLWPTP